MNEVNNIQSWWKWVIILYEQVVCHDRGGVNERVDSRTIAWITGDQHAGDKNPRDRRI